MPGFFLCGSPEFIRECREEAERQGIEIAGEATSPQDLYVLVDKVRPDALLAPSSPEWSAATVDLAKLRPNMKVFTAGPVSMETWAEYARVHVLTVPGEPHKAVREVVSVLKRLTPARFAFEESENDRAGAVSSKVIAFYSVKGGVGKTTVASNVAAYLGMWVKQHEEKAGDLCRVALLDFNSDGSTGVYTWCPDKPKTVALWSDLTLPAGWQDVAACMNYHESANVWYLAPPLTPAEREEFTAELAEKVFSITERFFHFVIVDMGVALDKRDPAVVALSTASDVLLVSDFDPDTIRLLAYSYKNEVRYLVGDPAKVSLVINCVHRTWYGVRDMVNLFGQTAGGMLPLKKDLPSDPKVEKYKGKGAPLACFETDAPLVREIGGLCRNILGTDVTIAKKETGGLFSRLKFKLLRK
jgi:Flp pilus assembly CpaE family ATPase